jgi:SAM-dependent methyltransferase
VCHDTVIDLYERHARAYDRDRSRTLQERPWLERFLERTEPGDAVLDLGCGVGEPIARFLIERGREVVGVDASPTMIGICRARFPGATWLVEDMRRLRLGRRFAGLVAWDSVFHLHRDDQRGIFERLAAHALPGAPLLFTSGPSAGESIGSYRGEPLYHASLDPSEYRQLLAASGFTVRDHVTEDPECGDHTVWLATWAPAPGADPSGTPHEP